MSSPTTPETKHCPRCEIDKPLTEFRQRTDARRPGKIYYAAYCHPCTSDYNKEHNGAVTTTKAKAANGRYEVKTFCEICRATGVKLYINLSQKTGKYQGTLCLDCNQGLEAFHDNKKLLERAIGYIAR